MTSSFASRLKEELAGIRPKTDHCTAATAEAHKYFTLIKKEYTINEKILERRCCKRTFLREIFLIAGTMSDPEKSYHFEINCPSRAKAEFIRDLINRFEGMDAKIVTRGRSYVTYLKGSDQIVDMLGIMEASKAYMELENVRIMKSVRNSVNRRINCETANIGKTVSASKKQLDDIALIKEKTGLNELPSGLAEMAEVRLKYPDAALTELGQYLNPPIGKSGVNHRLRKLSEIAGQLREKEENDNVK
ncbi:MAG: DNA-binding protein WhiA [Lachnospiraceae bacterium]|nr:DNA-binding protein WhiA [Lachnospiraceae bacterium]